MEDSSKHRYSINSTTIILVVNRWRILTHKLFVCLFFKTESVLHSVSVFGHLLAVEKQNGEDLMRPRGLDFVSFFCFFSLSLKCCCGQLFLFFLPALNFFICRVFKCTKRLLLSVLFELLKATFDGLLFLIILMSWA